MSANVLWNIVDLLVAVLAIINVISLLLLSDNIFKE